MILSYSSLQAEYSFIRGFCALAEFRDPDTGIHLDRMSVYSRILAEELAEKPEVSGGRPWSEQIFLAAPLHDIGKIGIPDRILFKPGKLTREERLIMNTHASLGAEFLTRMRAPMGHDEPDYLEVGIQIAATHHERWDGMGYPLGLAGEEIPLAGRIVAVADFYDALTNPRVYRKRSFSHEEVAAMIREGAGTHFAPDVVAAFFSAEKGIMESLAQLRDPLLSRHRTNRPPSVEETVPSFLIVEDERASQQMLVRHFQRLGFPVRVVGDVAEARGLLEEDHFDVVILDIFLPGEPGTVLLHELAPKAPDTVVVVMTGLGDVHHSIEALKGGAYDFILKPLDMLYFEVAIERALGRQRLERENRAYQARLESLVAAQAGLFLNNTATSPASLVAGGLPSKDS
jgi:response regulator RpfG family c-di-GMP phosphodiesterase